MTKRLNECDVANMYIIITSTTMTILITLRRRTHHKKVRLVQKAFTEYHELDKRIA